MKLTQSIVANITAPEGKSDVIHFDDDLPGLGVRVRASSKRSWIFRVGRERRGERAIEAKMPNLLLPLTAIYTG
jgi:hypothetical protein